MLWAYFSIWSSTSSILFERALTRWRRRWFHACPPRSFSSYRQVLSACGGRGHDVPADETGGVVSSLFSHPRKQLMLWQISWVCPLAGYEIDEVGRASDFLLPQELNPKHSLRLQVVQSCLQSPSRIRPRLRTGYGTRQRTPEFVGKRISSESPDSWPCATTAGMTILLSQLTATNQEGHSSVLHRSTTLWDGLALLTGLSTSSRSPLSLPGKIANPVVLHLVGQEVREELGSPCWRSRCRRWSQGVVATACRIVTKAVCQSKLSENLCHAAWHTIQLTCSVKIQLALQLKWNGRKIESWITENWRGQIWMPVKEIADQIEMSKIWIELQEVERSNWMSARKIRKRHKMAKINMDGRNEKKGNWAALADVMQSCCWKCDQSIVD